MLDGMKQRPAATMTRPPQAKKALPGQRQTRQRARVYEAIRRARGPLTVPEIHAAVCKTIPRTGIATVYRTVKLLLESEWIKSVTLPSGETRYESADLKHHHHFQCQTCGEVFDIDHCPITVHAGAELPGGYILQDHEITLYGTCPHCR